MGVQLSQMILSFHPCIEADRQIIMGDQRPDKQILSWVLRASAIILPQGCPEELYGLCRAHCANVFPNYDVRYRYPGKVGQTRLFRTYGISYPITHIWDSVKQFERHLDRQKMPHSMPFVVKADHGHEGDHVYVVDSNDTLHEILQTLKKLEDPSGQAFITQDFIPAGGKVLRVVVIGRRLFSYWKVASNPNERVVTISRGATIEPHGWPKLQDMGKEAVKKLCTLTGINLAAVDVIFSSEKKDPDPLILEINYYFGRRGLHGSDRYYAMLFEQVRQWLEERGLDPAAIRLV